MNEGVKILLARMETNPEEFLTEGLHIGSKWGSLIAEYSESLDLEDANALKTSLNKIKQQHFTERVMKELLAPEEDESLGKPWYSKQGNITLSAGQTLGHASLTLTTEPLVNKKPVLKKPHKTLFGKLFNYT